MIATDERVGEVGGLAAGRRVSRLILKAVWLIDLSLAISYVALVGRLWWTDDVWRTDFTTLYSIGAMVLAGDGHGLYDQSLLARYQQMAIGDRMVVERAIVYANPPYAAFLVAPLALAPPTTAYLVWAAAQLGLAVWALCLARVTTRDWSGEERRLLWVATLAYLPLFLAIMLGNLSLVLLVCLWQLYRDLRRGREWAAGGWLVLGLIKPQVWILVVVMLVATRRWRVLAGAATIGGALVVLSSLALGWTIWPLWLGRLVQTQGEMIPIMWNLRASLALWLGPSQASLANLLSLLLLAGAVGATAWLWRQPWRPVAPTTSARLALTVALGLLLAPYLYSHDTVLLAMAATLGYSVLRVGRWARLYTIFVLGAPLVLLIGESVLGAWLGRQVPSLLMIGLVGWLVVAVRHADRGEEAAGDGEPSPARAATHRPGDALAGRRAGGWARRRAAREP